MLTIRAMSDGKGYCPGILNMPTTTPRANAWLGIGRGSWGRTLRSWRASEVGGLRSNTPRAQSGQR